VNQRLVGRRLYLCTSDRPDLERFATACIEGGVDVVQFRDKTLDARDLIARARVLGAVCSQARVPFFMNDRPDLALEIGADGVHVGQDDAPASLARKILGPDALIGLSTHCEADLAAAEGQPVDYLSAGPVVATPTKPGRTPTGAAYAGRATAISSRPVFVTGGVTPTSVGSLVAAGVRRFVVVRWLTEAEDPRRAAVALSQRIDEAVDQVER
jgi:thiamine-phosphate pyrophosphorylase